MENGSPATPRAVCRRVGRRWVVPAGLVAGGLIAIVAAIVVGRSPPSIPGRPSQWEAAARARAYLGAGRADLALRAVAPIEDGEPGAGEALAVKGMALIALDRRAEARDTLERALRRHPGQPTAHQALASIYLCSGDYGRGLAHLRSAADLDASDPRPWIAMGKAYRDLGRDDESADSYQAACRRDPADRDARLELVAAALKTRRPDRATPHLVEALRGAPEDPRVLGLAARHAHALGHPEQAAAFAARALTRDPDNFDALVARGTSRALGGDSKGASADLGRAVEVNPIGVEALRLLAQVEARQGLNDRARESIARAQAIEDCLALFGRLAGEINRRPDDPELRWRMGQVAAMANMPEVAADSFLAALDLDPHCQPARIGLAALREGKGGKPPPR
jgi:tetratricopeptide (TPR) repeat protein